MCISTKPSRMSDTTIYAGHARLDDKFVHVLGYQNTADNLHDGPNAMILPLPTRVPVSQKNVIDVSGLDNLMKDFRDAIEPATKGGNYRGFLGDDMRKSKAIVFDSGAYTVVLAQDAMDIPEALKRVPENKRPEANMELFKEFRVMYPNWPVAVCCYDGSIKTTPMFWWFEPIYPGMLFAPALDAHNGKPPDLDVEVGVDHMLVFGSTMLAAAGNTVPYSKEPSQELFSFLPKKVVGTSVRGSLLNGDFWYPADKIGREYKVRSYLRRLQPTEIQEFRGH